MLMPKLMRISRRQYELKLANEDKSNPRRFFAHVRRNRCLQQRKMTLRAGDGAVRTDSPNMARILSNFYASVYRTDKVRDHPSLPEPPKIMNAESFTSAAGALHIRHCSGPDDLHPFMLQILADFLAEPITALYNEYLQSGEVPQDWRKAIICQIFK